MNSKTFLADADADGEFPLSFGSNRSMNTFRTGEVGSVDHRAKILSLSQKLVHPVSVFAPCKTALMSTAGQLYVIR